MFRNPTIQNVQVQTISWCNRSCEFCPSQKFPRKLELISLETYQRVLDELAAIGFAGRFSPFLQGEPLLDKRLPELVAMARKTLPRAKLLIQTNGDALTVEKGLALFEAGLHKLLINGYDDREQLARLQNLVREIIGKRPDLKRNRPGLGTMLRSESRDKIQREISIDNKTWWQVDTQENWAGNIPGALAKPLQKSCIRPFNQLYVHFNGNAVLCCCDWKGEVVFGNLLEKSLSEVWYGPVAAKYREKLARKDRRLKLCAVCNYRGNHPWQDRLLLSISRLFKKT